MSPGDFTVLRNKIESSPVLTEKEKSEWLVLLPRMTAEHIKELDRILAVKSPPHLSSPTTGGGTLAKNFPPPRGEESKEGGKKAVVFSSITSSPASPLHSPVGTIISTKPRVVSATETKAAEVAEFKLLTVEKMREAGSVYTFLETVTKKMVKIKHKKGVGTDALIAAFEQSPLYHAYLESGLRIMGQGDSPLTRSEFEAMADFRESLRKQLT